MSILDSDVKLEDNDPEKVIASLRASFEDAKAGRGRPIREVMAEIAKEFDLPQLDEE